MYISEFGSDHDEIHSNCVCRCAPGFMGNDCSDTCPISCDNGGDCVLDDPDWRVPPIMLVFVRTKLPGRNDEESVYGKDQTNERTK